MKTSSSSASVLQSRPLTSNRGSVLMVALILSGVIALSLTSYLSLAKYAAKMSNRSFYMDAAQDLCDMGIEQALWCMNNGGAWTTGNFSPVAGAAAQYQATFPSATTSYQYSAGVTGQVKIWADDSNPSIPHVVVKSIITLVDGSTLTKEAEAYMKIGSYFSSGMVGETINFSGGALKADSWNSNPSGDGVTAVPYSSSVANANASVGAVSVQANALDGSNGRVSGTVLAGSSDSTGINLQPQGAVGNATFISSGQTGIQSGHATYDFVSDFPAVTAPTTVNNVSLTSGGITLPQTNGSGTIIDTPSADGKYYYKTSQISLSGSNVLTIAGNVVIVTSSSTSTTVSVTGSSTVYIQPGASLALYTDGNVNFGGNGVVNGTPGSTSGANRPINFAIYGTRTSSTVTTSGYQTIQVGGNGYLSGVVYAPNGNVTVNGNGDVLGAIVGNTVNMNGGANFHYDESLASTGTSGLWQIRKWRELANPSEQAAYASNLTF